MQAVATIGLDIAKSVFQVDSVDATGNVIVCRQLKRRLRYERGAALGEEVGHLLLKAANYPIDHTGRHRGHGDLPMLRGKIPYVRKI
jgi:hypothetical protein